MDEFRRSQGDVQDCAFLRDVNLLAAEHRLNARAKATLLRELHEQLHRLAGSAIFRIVEIEAHGLRRQSLSAAGVIGKEPPQIQLAELPVMRFQGLPCRAGVGPGGEWVFEYADVR